MQRITIQTTVGPLEVPATVFRYLAIHKGVNDKCLYNVTHIPTGMSLVQDVMRQDAEDFVRQVAHLDWSTRSPEVLLTYKSAVLRARVSIQYGKSTA